VLRARLIIIKHNLKTFTFKEFLLRFILSFIGSNLISQIVSYFAQNSGFEPRTEQIIYYSLFAFYVFWGINRLAEKFENNIHSSPSSFLISISTFCFSSKNNEEMFKPIVADWQEEYFEALFKKEIWKARWINVRYTYAFLGAMWQKSPIGNLIEFVSKIAKQ